MSEERLKILSMVAEGKVTPEEAEKLLTAVEGSEGSSLPRTVNGDFPKYLYVRVEPKEGKVGADQVNVRVPIALIKAGVNFLGVLPSDAREGIQEAMDGKGIDFDFKNLRPEEMEALMAALQELQIDVETSDQIIKVYAG